MKVNITDEMGDKKEVELNLTKYQVVNTYNISHNITKLYYFFQAIF